MTDAWDYDETDNQNGPKPLRDAYKAQKEANEALIKRLAALEEQAKRSTVADLFESQGVPRGASKYYNGDADPEKVNAFVTEMRSTFGGGSPAATQTPSVPAPSTDEQAKLQNMMQAGADSNSGTNFDVAMSKMSDPTLSTADRIAAYAEFARLQS